MRFSAACGSAPPFQPDVRTTIAIPSLSAIADQVTSEIAADATSAMRGATDTLKTVLRRQVTDAGLGVRLSNTWRAETYPGSGDALNPAGYAWSNAPNIIDAFERGATMRPLGGKGFLWIPTRNVPRSRGRGTRKAMTPFEVEVLYDQDLIIRRGKAGRFLAFVSVVRGRSKRGGFRRATKGRLAQRRDAELVLMFVLVPSVTLPKKLDLEAAGQEGAAAFVSRFASKRG